jgi:hypothetical protein
MTVLGRLMQMMATAITLVCVGTVSVQVAGLGVAWSRGSLSPEKIKRYTGVLYGLDPLDVAPEKPDRPKDPVPETREEILADRVMRTPQLAERAAVIAKSADEIRTVTLTLKRNRERFVTARDEFESKLDELAGETEKSALRELQITLEVATPKQAKEILRSMLSKPPADPADNVMNDVVGIIKSLPDNKLRKILAEFKTEEEEKLLHRILLEIGELGERSTQLSRNQP